MWSFWKSQPGAALAEFPFPNPGVSHPAPLCSISVFKGLNSSQQEPFNSDFRRAEEKTLGVFLGLWQPGGIGSQDRTWAHPGPGLCPGQAQSPRGSVEPPALSPAGQSHSCASCRAGGASPTPWGWKRVGPCPAFPVLPVESLTPSAMHTPTFVLVLCLKKVINLRFIQSD